MLHDAHVISTTLVIENYKYKLLIKETRKIMFNKINCFSHVSTPFGGFYN